MDDECKQLCPISGNTDVSTTVGSITDDNGMDGSTTDDRNSNDSLSYSSVGENYNSNSLNMNLSSESFICKCFCNIYPYINFIIALYFNAYFVFTKMQYTLMIYNQVTSKRHITNFMYLFSTTVFLNVTTVAKNIQFQIMI